MANAHHPYTVARDPRLAEQLQDVQRRLDMSRVAEQDAAYGAVQTILDQYPTQNVPPDAEDEVRALADALDFYIPRQKRLIAGGGVPAEEIAEANDRVNVLMHDPNVVEPLTGIVKNMAVATRNKDITGLARWAIKKRNQADYTRFEQWSSGLFDVGNPYGKLLYDKYVPQKNEARRKVLRMAFQTSARLHSIALFGPQRPSDVPFLYMVRTGVLKPAEALFMRGLNQRPWNPMFDGNAAYNRGRDPATNRLDAVGNPTQSTIQYGALSLVNPSSAVMEMYRGIRDTAYRGVTITQAALQGIQAATGGVIGVFPDWIALWPA